MCNYVDMPIENVDCNYCLTTRKDGSTNILIKTTHSSLPPLPLQCPISSWGIVK